MVIKNILLPGYWYDEESDLYYNWHRYYDPITGRYLQADPLAAPAVSNLYGYARNNPLSFIDPTGLWVPYYDPIGNRILVENEAGEGLASLYAQLRIPVDQLAKYKVNESTYDITSLFTEDPSIFQIPRRYCNCCTFIALLTGKINKREIDCKDFLTTMGLSEADKISGSPIFGDIALWTLTGWDRQPPLRVWGEDGELLADFPEASMYYNNHPGHAAMYIMKNNAEENYYLQVFPNTGVVIGTVDDVIRSYCKIVQDRIKQSPENVAAMLNKNPIFYRLGGL